MKVKLITVAVISFMVASIISAQPHGPKGKPIERHHGWGRGQHRGEFFQERINKLAEKGVITEQEKQELNSAIEDLKKYRQEVWSDGKLTKEEHQTLIEKEKAVKDKTRQVLEKAREEMFEDLRDPKEREKMFNERIEFMLKNKKITQKEADELKKQHKELLNLEEKIWADGVMTKDEQRELFKKRREFMERVRKLHHKKSE